MSLRGKLKMAAREVRRLDAHAEYVEGHPGMPRTPQVPTPSAGDLAAWREWHDWADAPEPTLCLVWEAGYLPCRLPQSECSRHAAVRP